MPGLRRAVLSVALAVAALYGCGDVRITLGDYHCPDGTPPAIVVEFVAAADGAPVAVEAGGTLRDGPYFEQMVPTTGSRHAGPGRTFALAGGYDREGIYDVRVETSFGEVQEWTRIRVQADRCGPFTVVLQARLRILR